MPRDAQADSSAGHNSSSTSTSAHGRIRSNTRATHGPASSGSTNASRSGHSLLATSTPVDVADERTSSRSGRDPRRPATHAAAATISPADAAWTQTRSPVVLRRGRRSVRRSASPSRYRRRVASRNSNHGNATSRPRRSAELYTQTPARAGTRPGIFSAGTCVLDEANGGRATPRTSGSSTSCTSGRFRTGTGRCAPEPDHPCGWSGASAPGLRSCRPCRG